MGTELMKHTEREVAQEQGSKFKFTGYEVSVEDFGRTYCTFIYFTTFICQSRSSLKNAENQI